jgi:hypothetical protein
MAGTVLRSPTHLHYVACGDALLWAQTQAGLSHTLQLDRFRKRDGPKGELPSSKLQHRIENSMTNSGQVELRISCSLHLAELPWNQDARI